MFLPSRLERSTLGDVLGGLHRAGVSGWLELIDGDGGGRAALHLERGTIVRVEGSGPRVGERIARSVPDRQRIDAALASEAPAHELAAAALARRGLATEAELRVALEEQARDRLERLFAVRRADVRFHVARSAARGLPVALGPATFLHGRPRATPRGRSERVERERDEATGSLCAALGMLGLAAVPAPTLDVVRRAFRTRAAALHPDRARTPEARAAMAHAFTRLAAAYERALAAC